MNRSSYSRAGVAAPGALVSDADSSGRQDGGAHAAPKISIILPLFDRRNAGWGSLRSALAQRFPRERYEVVAVTARGHTLGAHDPDVDRLLARCDRVVHADLDDTIVANEIQL